MISTQEQNKNSKSITIRKQKQNWTNWIPNYEESKASFMN